MLADIVIWIFAVIGFLASIIQVVQFFQRMRFRRKLTWDDSLRIAEKLLKDIQESGWDPDFVLGLGRSGGIWGGWLAGNLGSLPFSVVDDRYMPNNGLQISFPAGENTIKAIREFHPSIKNLLVVEGASAHGGTINKFRKQMENELRDLDVRFAVLYKNPASAAKIEYVGQVGPEPWPDRFPWHFSNLFRPYLRDIFHINNA